MINRQNYLDTQEHLEFRHKVLQNSPKTIRGYRLSFRHLLEWADSTLFDNAIQIEPAFPLYLIDARKDLKDKPMSPVHLSKICTHARVFFKWAKREYPIRYKDIYPSWIDSLRPTKASLANTEIKTHVFWTLDDVKKIAALDMSDKPLKMWRSQAAVVFLYLSGMRATAFLTLPVSCVDIETRRIEQLPSKGVQTKNSKAAITTFLNIPELIDVIKKWDDYVRKYAPDGLWHSMLKTTGIGSLVTERRTKSPEGMRMQLTEQMKKLCDLTGVEYKSPHKLRHGHGIYGIKNAKDIEQLKAVSQNLMHANLSITDGIYGQLTHEGIIEGIMNLGKDKSQAELSLEDEDQTLKTLLKLLIRKNPDLIAGIFDEGE